MWSRNSKSIYIKNNNLKRRKNKQFSLTNTVFGSCVQQSMQGFAANHSRGEMCPFCRPGAERAILTHMHTVHAHPRANVDRYCQRAC